MSSHSNAHITIKNIKKELEVAGIDDVAWKTAERISIDRYWSGSVAPRERHFEARLLWSALALYVRFEARQAEPLVISGEPDVTKKTMNLWDRDVCEIFVAPDPAEPQNYYEFEVAPTGEWLDVALDLTSGNRISDWKYASRMETFSQVESFTITMVIKVPWDAFSKKPRVGDVWLGNIFRCIGSGQGRGYLAWQPTLTSEPAFHIPEKFGEFRFTD